VITPLNNDEKIASTANPTVTLVFANVVDLSPAKRGAALDAGVGAPDHTGPEGFHAEYLRLVRSAVAEHNGKEILTIGDTFFLTFDAPVDAIRCAAGIQQRLCAQPINTPSGPMRLRIGIHVGTPEYFENSWHGTDVDIAARAQSAGLPGQIIVTESACKALGCHSDIKFRRLGTFALKGVGDIGLCDVDYNRHKLRRAAITSIEQRRRRRMATSVAFILGAIALVNGTGQRLRQDQVAAVLASTANQFVADLENSTSVAVIDNAPTDGLTVKLEQPSAPTLINQRHPR